MGIVAEAKAASGPGFYLTPWSAGFTVHLTASAFHLTSLRRLVEDTLRRAGVDGETTASVQLVASELIGNSVRACGDFVPLVVDVEAGSAGVSVKVHDPDGNRFPCQPKTALDDAYAESGRGLGLVGLLTFGWYVVRTPVGKQVCCCVAYQGGSHA
jgi:anti-sigma regulatory factor (Ser/Thr protein kinase)